MNHSTGESLQPQNTGSPTPASAAVDGGGELIFPEQMLPDERQAARVLSPCGDHAQALLDELAGRLQMGGVRSSPVAYLRGLIARAGAGSFIPTPVSAGSRVCAAPEGGLCVTNAKPRNGVSRPNAPRPSTRPGARAQREGQADARRAKTRMNTGRQP